MKLAAEALIRSYAANFSCGSIIARLSNVYGPGMSEKTVVGKILAQAERGEPIRVMDETPVRDFIFSHDVVEALIRLSLLKRNNSALTVNVSTGIGVSIGSMVAEAAKLFSAPKAETRCKKDISESPSRLVLSNEKIKRLTGWAPLTRLAEGLLKCKNHAIKND
jgi:nucleoside-diphosphate-sugar epimerase